MDLPKFGKMPGELQQICRLFDAAGLQYNLFKCEHILQGANKNLDLLFLHGLEYEKASKILEKEGYLLYLDEPIEKYKRMYVKHQKETNTLTAVHLHREVAWHGIPVLDKGMIFARAKENLPSPEDALLIHSAHALFENFQVKPFQKELLLKYQKEAQDKQYINQHLSQFGWKTSFWRFAAEDFSVSKKMILSAYAGRFTQNPLLLVSPLSKISKKILRSLSLKRKGILITLSGVNGAGKTTMVNELLKIYQPTTAFFHGQKGYYFGWDPFLPVTKILSRAAKKKNIYQKLNQETTKISLKKEAILSYDFIEYYSRYLWHIYPALRKGKMVVTDRYFYDLYAQHSYAEKSKVMKPLLRLFPKPDFLFILNADLAAIIQRDKNTSLLSTTATRSKERDIHDQEDLENQRRRYLQLPVKSNRHIINTTKPIKENVNTIIQTTWKSLAHN